MSISTPHNLLILPVPQYEHATKIEDLISLVTDSVASEHTKRSYNRALRDFLTYWIAVGKPQFSKALIQSYINHLLEIDMGRASIGQRLTAIRKLAYEAVDNQLLSESVAASIKRIKAPKHTGQQIGNWLTLEQTQELVNKPDISTPKGLRDRAILATLVGSGIRRTEASTLSTSHIQKRDDRWVIIDLVGKGHRVRSVPIADWVYEAINAWLSAADIKTGRIFRPFSRVGNIIRDQISPKTISNVVQRYGRACDLEISAHDLRRTFAKLSHQKNSPIEQIQLSMGHVNIKTTEIYLGVEQDFRSAPSDSIDIDLT